MRNVWIVVLALTAAMAFGASQAAADTLNLALVENGGTASASSETVGGSAAGLNDGRRQLTGWWTDSRSSSEPGWAQIAWTSAKRIDRVVLRMPVVSSSHPLAERTFGLLRVQYWDGTGWVDVDAAGNPIADWVVPTSDDGTQVRTFGFEPISTTKIRVYFERDNGLGDAGLEEIEAYGLPESACETNLALAANGGTASGSSENVGGSAVGLNDGIRQASGWWTDSPSSSETGWAQIAWAAPQTLMRIVVRMPVVSSSHPLAERTFGLLRVQYWDGASWVDVSARGNPIVDWAIPTSDDGTQVRTFEFLSIRTTKIRVYFERDNAYGDSGLEEIEAYAPESACWGNVALAANGGSASASSETIAGSAAGLNDGVRQTSGWWTDSRSSSDTGWAQIAWANPQTLAKIVVRMPVVWFGASVEERTFGLLRVQYWDGTSWIDVDATGNPIVNWTIPVTDDGTQIRSFEIDPISTTKIRVYFERDNSTGDAGLEEIEAWALLA
jgi:hypothetical protein